MYFFVVLYICFVYVDVRENEQMNVLNDYFTHFIRTGLKHTINLHLYRSRKAKYQTFESDVFPILFILITCLHYNSNGHVKKGFFYFWFYTNCIRVLDNQNLSYS